MPPQPVAVAHLGPDPASEGGGIPTVVRGLLASDLSGRYRLTVIPTQRRVSVAGRIAISARAIVALARFCAGPGPRIVHIHVTVRGSMYRKAILAGVARALRRPVVLHVHAGAHELERFHARLGPVRRAAFRATFRHAQHVLAVSGATARVVERDFGAPPVEVLPNAAPLPVDGDRPAERSPGEGSILYLGGFANPVKGGRTLLDAVPQVLDRAPGARFVLAGPGEPPPDMPAGDERVRWVGWIDGPAKAGRLREADLFVLPSASEGLPMALLEAMAYGKGIVATDVGGVGDVLTDGREGVVVPPGDPDALAAAILGLIDDVERSSALGRAARERAARSGPAQFAERLDHLYRELVDGA